MLRCVSLRVLAASCSLPPSGGRPRAAARCAALRRGRGLSRCFGRCGGLAFRSAGGRCPPRRCPAVAPPRVLPLGLLRFAPAAVALVLRARGFAPAPFAVSGRRFGRCGRCAACSLPCSRGAPPPSAASPFVRVGAARCPPAPLVPASLRPRGLRRVVSAPRRPSPVAAVRLRLGSPPPCQRAAAAACGGRAAAGGAFGGRCGGRLLWRFAPPRVGFGVSAAAAALFSRLLRRAASPALLVCLAFGCGLLRALLRAPPAVIWLRPALLVRLAFGCGFLRALTAALKPRGLFAPPAHLLFKAKIGCKAQPQAQHFVPTIHLIYHIQASSAKLELFCRIICGFCQ